MYRSHKAISDKWREVQHDCTKFIALYKFQKTLNLSGWTEEMLIEDIEERFKDEPWNTRKKKFNFISCFHLILGSSKFNFIHESWESVIYQRQQRKDSREILDSQDSINDNNDLKDFNDASQNDNLDFEDNDDLEENYISQDNDDSEDMVDVVDKEPNGEPEPNCIHTGRYNLIGKKKHLKERIDKKIFFEKMNDNKIKFDLINKNFNEKALLNSIQHTENYITLSKGILPVEEIQVHLRELAELVQIQRDRAKMNLEKESKILKEYEDSVEKRRNEIAEEERVEELILLEKEKMRKMKKKQYNLQNYLKRKNTQDSTQ